MSNKAYILYVGRWYKRNVSKYRSCYKIITETARFNGEHLLCRRISIPSFVYVNNHDKAKFTLCSWLVNL